MKRSYTATDSVLRLQNLQAIGGVGCVICLQQAGGKGESRDSCTDDDCVVMLFGCYG